MEQRRIRLRIAYDGTAYCGYQIQHDKPTVEKALKEAIKALTGEETVLIGASRTDSGVHALSNVAVFDTASSIPAEKFAPALNRWLPEDIRVVKSDECRAGWHPRKQDTVKTYVYRVCNERTEMPLGRQYAYHFPFPVSLSDMRRAAAYLEGTHDFTSFSNPDSQILKQGKSAVREIFSIKIDAGKTEDAEYKEAVTESGKTERVKDRREIVSEEKKTTAAPASANRCYKGMIEIRVTGNGFLYNMVRILAGTLLEVGAGRIKAEDMPQILEAKDRTRAGLTAPAKGLCLEQLSYIEALETKGNSAVFN